MFFTCIIKFPSKNMGEICNHQNKFSNILLQINSKNATLKEIDINSFKLNIHRPQFIQLQIIGDNEKCFKFNEFKKANSYIKTNVDNNSTAKLILSFYSVECNCKTAQQKQFILVFELKDFKYNECNSVYYLEYSEKDNHDFDICQVFDTKCSNCKSANENNYNYIDQKNILNISITTYLYKFDDHSL